MAARLKKSSRKPARKKTARKPARKKAPARKKVAARKKAPAREKAVARKPVSKKAARKNAAAHEPTRKKSAVRKTAVASRPATARVPMPGERVRRRPARAARATPITPSWVFEGPNLPGIRLFWKPAVNVATLSYRVYRLARSAAFGSWLGNVERFDPRDHSKLLRASIPA